ncbi:hypothetical protein E2A64_08745 [Pseudohoeflea suaedae]|uniref:Uncharacterized protein n=1 Tax=Pseudohoeflea suaedae TaxID=877384 RepID=A0A4R5PRA6_9HYPH|nr:hypothetical protein [Pseudohoeflea suaedae]TDH39147.1 hypothetical protein E2A64_08745 [Pseudohoeflea suaedae]
MAQDDLHALVTLLDRVAKAGFHTDRDWAAAHNLCQAREGQAPFDWAHAICHRIEGDDGNAAYWYRRAGRTPAGGTLADEWRAAREVMLATP